jgi:hypothetical protein
VLQFALVAREPIGLAALPAGKQFGGPTLVRFVGAGPEPLRVNREPGQRADLSQVRAEDHVDDRALAGLRRPEDGDLRRALVGRARRGARVAQRRFSQQQLGQPLIGGGLGKRRVAGAAQRPVALEQRPRETVDGRRGFLGVAAARCHATRRCRAVLVHEGVFCPIGAVFDSTAGLACA